MPTVGWIVENAIEHYWDAMPPSWLGDPLPVFDCGFCEEAFELPADLRRHLALKHPLEQPTLYLEGRPLLRESIVRGPVDVNEIVPVASTAHEIQVNGTDWTSVTGAELSSMFAACRNETWKIRLTNSRRDDDSQSSTTYTVRFRIPDQAELSEVDERFVDLLATDDLSHIELRMFESSLPKQLPAREYASALGNYALGLLLKDRREIPRSSVTFDEYVVKMKEAMAVLVHFPRPIAVAISTTIRFELNDFTSDPVGQPEMLTQGLGYFRNILANNKSGLSDHHGIPEGVSRPICPVSSTTHKLLTSCNRFRNGQVSPGELETLRQITRGGFSTYDIEKARVLCADGFLKIGRDDDARDHLLSLQFHPVFGPWANGKLGE